jgi:polyisoprenyl-phosphate glycosyltransferase
MTSVKIPRDVGDFRLVGRKALDTFKMMPERDRFVRGMFAWMGFKQTNVEFERPARAAGETKYPLWKMIRLATNGIISFSEVPLRLALWAGLAISILACGIGVFAIVSKLMGLAEIDGWASTIVIVSFLSGINLFMTGIVGLYVGGIYSEVKRRPLYVVGHDSLEQSALSTTTETKLEDRVPATLDRRFR